MELCDLPALDLTRLIQLGEISAVEVLESTLGRVSAVDGRPGTLDPGDIENGGDKKVHAFIHLTPERARAQAEQIDRQLAAGEDPGPLAGVPFTVKDIFCVQDTLSTAGSRILANFVAPYTATPVARLEAAGGVLLGKVNLDEFTYASACAARATP